jgi:putative DNA primase/helicase
MSGYAIYLTGGGWVEVPSFEVASDEALLIRRDEGSWPFVIARSEWLGYCAASNVINAAASGGKRRMKRNRIQSEVAEYFAEKSKGPGPILGRALLSEDNYARGRDGQLYVYEGGVYAPASSHVKRRINRWSADNWTQRVQNETIGWLLTEADELDDSLDPDVINVKNGLLRWDGRRWRLTKHDPALRTTMQLPVVYDPKARCPIYDRYIGSSQPTKNVQRFTDEWLGYNLTSDCSHERALLNIGRGGDGKSVFLFILEHLLGTRNVAGKTLQSVATEENRFAAADLYGKLANIYADLSASELKDTGRFKALVSGDLISGEKKRKDPFEFHNVAKMTFSANEVPASRDASRAYFDRWSVVWWPIQFRDTDADDKQLKAKVVGSAAEMSGVLNRALGGLTRLRRTGQFTSCEELDIAKGKFRYDSDNVAAYLRDAATTIEVRRRQIDWYADYKGWCTDSKHLAVSNHKFYERMRQWNSAYGITVVATTSHKQRFFKVAKVGGRRGR